MVRKKNNTKFFIKDAIKKSGSLSNQIGIPENRTIPFSLLRVIKKSKIGSIINNPSSVGNKKIKVTKLLKKRAIFALVLKNIVKKQLKSRNKRK